MSKQFYNSVSRYFAQSFSASFPPIFIDIAGKYRGEETQSSIYRDSIVLSIKSIARKCEKVKIENKSEEFTDEFIRLKIFRVITTITRVLISANCELLCVYKEDFNVILKETMSKKNENIKSAIRRFEYFKNFSDDKVSFS